MLGPHVVIASICVFAASISAAPHGCCSWDWTVCGNTTSYCVAEPPNCEISCKGQWLHPDPHYCELQQLGMLRPSPQSGSCSSRFQVPPQPSYATAHNGVTLSPVCFGERTGPHHVFIIGDWGGQQESQGGEPKPADMKHRNLTDIDYWAQHKVACEMRKRAQLFQPDYVLNVGDCFYPGGLNASCGLPLAAHIETHQFGPVFERIYSGPGLDELQWLGVLGNHDYGGWKFTGAWDQIIGYTWSTRTGRARSRWVMPAQYWSVCANYPDFSVDYYFVDSNRWDAHTPDFDPGHNLCGAMHNDANATCGNQGPTDVIDCSAWFERLWDVQEVWLEGLLKQSTSEWQIVVTHFPPGWGGPFWERMSRLYGVDMIISGHTHFQQVLHMGANNVLRPTAVIISGGGGGIVPEASPVEDGEDDAYGFMDLALTKTSVTISAVSHSGVVRSETKVMPRLGSLPSGSTAATPPPPPPPLPPPTPPPPPPPPSSAVRRTAVPTSTTVMERSIESLPDIPSQELDLPGGVPCKCNWASRVGACNTTDGSECWTICCAEGGAAMVAQVSKAALWQRMHLPRRIHAGTDALGAILLAFTMAAVVTLWMWRCRPKIQNRYHQAPNFPA